MVKSARLAHNTQDDGFHEIQLNGKQLVFLFMAATVVSVVIFLCGVLVGRGVRAERTVSSSEAAGLGAVASAEAAPSAAPASVPAATGTANASATSGSDPTKAAPPPAVDDLSYFNRLEKSNAPAEKLKPATEKPAAKAAAAETHAAPLPSKDQPAHAASQAAPNAAASTVEPGGSGFAVQIAALNVRGEADAIARRLNAKGYAAYVLAPPSGSPPVYRVRVGKFKTRHEAENVAARLQKEEQYTPWITR